MARNWESLGIPRDQAERHRFYRTALLQAAEAEFIQHGFSHAKAHHIARRADVSPSTLYKFFTGKTDLWNALHAERTEDMVSAILGAPQKADPIDQIIEAARVVANYLADAPTFLELQIAGGLNWATADQAGFGPGKGQKTAWLLGQDLLISGINAAGTDRRLSGLRPELVAGIVVSTLQLWLFDWVRRGRRESTRSMVNGLDSCLRQILTGSPC